jgi:hypothetical protein
MSVVMTASPMLPSVTRISSACCVTRRCAERTASPIPMISAQVNR